MAQQILIKRSSTPAAQPSTGDIALGELALNSTDGKLFMKIDNGGESIIEIGGAAAGTATWGGIDGTLSDQTDLQAALNVKSNVGHSHSMSDITDATWISDITDESIGDLSDVNLTGIADGQILVWNGTTFEPGDKSAVGATTFVGLDDTPADYSNTVPGQVVAVNATSTGLEFIDVVIPTDVVTSVHGRVGEVVGASGDYSAVLVDYDNTASGLAATETQGAIDEVESRVEANETAITNLTNTVTNQALGDHSDVDFTVTAPASGDLLQFNGTNWVVATTVDGGTF